MDALIRAEFHTHTCYSHDSLVKIDDFLDTCNKKGLDRVAITDHNEIKGAFIAKELDPERVIVGDRFDTHANHRSAQSARCLYQYCTSF